MSNDLVVPLSPRLARQLCRTHRVKVPKRNEYVVLDSQGIICLDKRGYYYVGVESDLSRIGSVSSLPVMYQRLTQMALRHV